MPSCPSAPSAAPWIFPVFCFVGLGQPMIVSEKFFPWFGATYANVEVWADVAPP